MSIKDLFRNQLSKVIEWKNPQPQMLWWKFPNVNDEIKNASKLIVNPGQAAVLVYEGKVADIIVSPGMYVLETDNHPFLTNLMKLRQNFESEHKLLIFFYKTTELVNQFWGTASPIKYFDASYNIPIEMGANGNFSYKIEDIVLLHQNIIGNVAVYSAEDMRETIISRIDQKIANLLSDKKLSFSEIDGQLNELSIALLAQLQLEYASLGLRITDFRISGTQFDKNTQDRISRVADVSADVIAAKEGGLSYVELEQLRALRDAARNEGGLAGVGAQLGAGMEIGKMFSKEKDALSLPTADVYESLKKLKLLLDENIITGVEFEAKKKELLNKL